VVEEVAPDLGELVEAFLVLRSQSFVVDRELQLQTMRDQLKPDIIWNTERGLAVTPGAATPAFDVMLRNPVSIASAKLEHYMAGSMLNAAITMAGCPAVAVPCRFDQYGRPVGLQIAAAARRMSPCGPPRCSRPRLACSACCPSIPDRASCHRPRRSRSPRHTPPRRAEMASPRRIPRPGPRFGATGLSPC
jgi:hypothetical protein